MPRRTDDKVALILASAVFIIVVSTAISTLFVVIVHPDQDVTRAADAIGRLVSVMVAALVGYMAGRPKEE